MRLNKFKMILKVFSHKIETAKKSQATEDFMIIARIESLILEKGMNDAIARAKAYINAGADAILIHSKQKTPKEVFEFSKNIISLGQIILYFVFLPVTVRLKKVIL